MARHLGFLAGFVTTCAVVVPLAWHPLDASIERDGKHVRPLQQSFVTTGGAKVTLDVDHNLIAIGDSVTATLRAYADAPGQVGVDVAVYYSDDEWGGRVSSPPKAIDLEHLTLQAAPDGGKPVETRIRLTGTGKINSFRIFAMPRGHQLDIWNEQTPEVAAVPVFGWGGNDLAISIHAEGPVIAGKPVTVAVRVKNTTGHAVRRPYLELGSQIAMAGITASDDVQIEDASDDPYDYEHPLAAGRTMTRKFVVTPTSADAKQVTLIATAFVPPEDIGKTTEGAMDAKTLTIAHADGQVAEQ